ncbi:MAG: ferredoxin thioredoxin reductase catalytic beta chain [Lentisphaeria bacterium]|nr:ferredoxin thioredoxin reductase catalytic beta chain [Lentisphaeria bacterium]
MAKNGGYCPCRLQHIPENLCICQEFQQQIADENFSGYCHCHLYYKEK